MKSAKYYLKTLFHVNWEDKEGNVEFGMSDSQQTFNHEWQGNQKTEILRGNSIQADFQVLFCFLFYGSYFM